MLMENEQRQCQRFSNSDNNFLLCKSLLGGSLFCSSMQGELLFYCAWKFHLFFLQDHQNGSPHHRADLVRQVNGTRAKRISTTFVVMRPSFKRNLKKSKDINCIIGLEHQAALSARHWCFISISPPVEGFLLPSMCTYELREVYVRMSFKAHRDTQAAGTCGLALWVMWNTCQPQRENASDSQRQLPLSLHSASFSYWCFACQLVPLRFKLTSCFIPSFSLSAGSLDSLLCFSFSSLWHNSCLTRYSWIHRRGKHVSGFICDTFFLPATQISRITDYSTVDFEQDFTTNALKHRKQNQLCHFYPN